MKVRHWIHQTLADERGMLTFEYILIATLLIFGIVGGLAVARDTIIVKMTDLTASMGTLDHSCGFTADDSPEGVKCPYLIGEGKFEDGDATIRYQE